MALLLIIIAGDALLFHELDPTLVPLDSDVSGPCKLERCRVQKVKPDDPFPATPRVCP